MTDGIRAQMSPAEWAMLIVLSILWGGSFFFIVIAIRDMPALTLVLMRVALAAAGLWIFVRATGRPVPRGATVWIAFLVMGLLNNVIPFSLIALGQKHITAGLASILNATTPLWTVLVTAALLADERATPRKLIGVVLGLGGVAVMMGLDALAADGGHGIWPQLAILGAAISYAFAGTFGRRFRRMGVDPVVTAAGMLTGSAVILLVPALVIDGMPGGYAPASWASVAALALLSSAVAYVLFFRILATAGATNLSLVTFLVPVSAILLGWAFLGERLGVPQFVGMGLIAAGLILIDGRLMSRRIPAA